MCLSIALDFMCMVLVLRMVDVIIFRVFCILDTTNIVKTCDYLYLNNEIYFAKPLKMSEPCAG